MLENYHEAVFFDEIFTAMQRKYALNLLQLKVIGQLGDERNITIPLHILFPHILHNTNSFGVEEEVFKRLCNGYEDILTKDQS